VETRVIRAKVIDRADQGHPVLQRQRVTRERPTTACQGRQALPTRGVEPLDGGGLDAPITLRAASERLHACRRAIANAALGRDHPPSLVALDDLGDQDMAPRTKPWPPARARVHGIAKGLAHGPDGGTQPIGTQQQRTVRGTAADPLDQAPDQRHVALRADFPAPPKSGLHHHRHGHPDDTALFLDAQLIGLDLSQVPRLLDQIRVHGLALTARTGPPIRSGTLVESKRRPIACTGHPWASKVTMRTTVSAAVRSR